MRRIEVRSCPYACLDSRPDGVRHTGIEREDAEGVGLQGGKHVGILSVSSCADDNPLRCIDLLAGAFRILDDRARYAIPVFHKLDHFGGVAQIDALFGCVIRQDRIILGSLAVHDGRMSRCPMAIEPRLLFVA